MSAGSMQAECKMEISFFRLIFICPIESCSQISSIEAREKMNRSLLRRSRSLLCICALLFPSPTFAQQPSSPKKFELTVDGIMRGPDLVGYEPTRVYWSQDGQRVYFRWKRAGEARLKEPDLYVVNRDGSDLRKLSEDEAKQAPPLAGDISKDKTMTVYAEEGDLYIYDQVKRERRQITSTVDGENSPRFTKDQKYIVFTRLNNLYRMALDGGQLTQLKDTTRFRRRRQGAAPAGRNWGRLNLAATRH
jgi:Tol biopolymer transport system component